MAGYFDETPNNISITYDGISYAYSQLDDLNRALNGKVPTFSTLYLSPSEKLAVTALGNDFADMGIENTSQLKWNTTYTYSYINETIGYGFIQKSTN